VQQRTGVLPAQTPDRKQWQAPPLLLLAGLTHREHQRDRFGQEAARNERQCLRRGLIEPLRWLIWVALLPLGMLAAYTGTLLPDDGLSGGSLAVDTGVLLSVPVIGTHLVFAIFGGAPPGHQIIGRAYWVHILVLPALAGALLLAAFRPPLRRPRRVRPGPLLPVTGAVLVALGAIAQINPVWLIGPYQPGSITSRAGPAAAAPALRQAVSIFTGAGLTVEDGLRWGWMAQGAASALWDSHAWHVMLVRQLQLARGARAAAAPARLAGYGGRVER
jgi:hypothetical protein